jgi:hypothetical protein
LIGFRRWRRRRMRRRGCPSGSVFAASVRQAANRAYFLHTAGFCKRRRGLDHERLFMSRAQARRAGKEVRRPGSLESVHGSLRGKHPCCPTAPAGVLPSRALRACAGHAVPFMPTHAAASRRSDDQAASANTRPLPTALRAHRTPETSRLSPTPSIHERHRASARAPGGSREVRRPGPSENMDVFRGAIHGRTRATPDGTLPCCLPEPAPRPRSPVHESTGVELRAEQ